MQKLIVLLVLIVLIGCSKPIEPECQNTTITNTVETIKFIDRNITIPCNTTNNTYEYKGTTSREIELIRRIKFLEGQQDKYWNDSECHDDLNRTEKELIDCEEVNCEWNSTWC